jgi:hypothetical protein
MFEVKEMEDLIIPTMDVIGHLANLIVLILD